MSAWDESSVSRHSVNVPKRTLSSSTQATKEIDSLFDGIDSLLLSNAQFEDVNIGKFHESHGEVSPRQRDYKRNVDDDALVGGSTVTPHTIMFPGTAVRPVSTTTGYITQTLTSTPKSSSLWQKHSAELVVLSSLHTETTVPMNWDGGTA